MPRIWNRRNLVGAAAGTMALVAVTLGGLTVGTAAAAPATPTIGNANAQPAAVAALHGNDGGFDLFPDANWGQDFNFDGENIKDLTKFLQDPSAANVNSANPNKADDNDLFSSIANNSSTAMCVYTDINFGGQTQLITPGLSVQDLKNIKQNTARPPTSTTRSVGWRLRCQTPPPGRWGAPRHSQGIRKVSVSSARSGPGPRRRPSRWGRWSRTTAGQVGELIPDRPRDLDQKIMFAVGNSKTLIVAVRRCGGAASRTRRRGRRCASRPPTRDHGSEGQQFGGERGDGEPGAVPVHGRRRTPRVIDGCVRSGLSWAQQLGRRLPGPAGAVIGEGQQQRVEPERGPGSRSTATPSSPRQPGPPAACATARAAATPVRSTRSAARSRPAKRHRLRHQGLTADDHRRPGTTTGRRPGWP